MKKDFQKLISTLQDSIFTWDYFSDFGKVEKNVDKIKKELNLLNSLIGSQNIEKDFIELVREYPKTRKVLPILIAIRESKLKEMDIISDVKKFIPENKSYLFNDKFNNKIEKELLNFFKESGLKSIFENKNIKNIVDYVFGVEIGMDTNARKNRTGVLMENLVEKFIADFCEENKNFKYLAQANKKKIKDNFGYDIKIDKNNRSFDFAVLNIKKNKLFLFEVNYYGTTGTKLKATAGEFEKLNTFLKKQSLNLYWITDGKGWISSKKSLEEAYLKNDGNIFNIEMLKEDVLKEILNKNN